MSRAADILVTNRPLVEADLTLLESILLKDGYRPGAGREFFMEPGTVARVYEDAQGPIVFTRCAPVLRLDAKFVSNADVKHNLRALMGGLPALTQQAKEDSLRRCFSAHHTHHSKHLLPGDSVSLKVTGN